MSILHETQLQRDKELAKLLGMSLEDVQKLPIASPDSIRVCSEEKAKTITPQEYGDTMAWAIPLGKEMVGRVNDLYNNYQNMSPDQLEE